jgi:alpha-D-xyloside xylohydrolase
MVDQERKLSELRYQLLPYIYSQAANVTFHGGTIMRPLVMDFANDRRALDQKYEYMFGPAFLVAPVVDAGVTQSHIYAPRAKGGWYDWWTGKAVAAGTDTVVDSPLGRIPLLVRAGSIVPLGPTQQYVGEAKQAPLELRIYAGADGQFDLYSDDGLTYRYERGESSTVRLVWNDATGTLTVSNREGKYDGMPAQQEMTIRVLRHGKWSEKHATYDGSRLSIRFLR